MAEALRQSRQNIQFLHSRDFFVCDVAAVFGKGFGCDDETSSALQVQRDALEAWSAEHVAQGGRAYRIESH